MNTTASYTTDWITAGKIYPSYHTVPTYVLVVSIISCCLSLVGVLCIFVSYYAVASVRNYIRKLLLYLTTANLIDVVGIIIGLIRYMLLDFTDEKYDKQRQLCVFQGMVTSFAPCSSFFWTVLIAVYFQVQVLRPSWADKLSSKCSTVVYHILAWGIPGIICTLALFYKVFGDTEDIFTGPWCWIKTNQAKKPAVLWMFLTVKGWELLSYLILGEVLVFVVFKTYLLPGCLRQRRRHYSEMFDQSINMSARVRLRKEDKNFVYVWLIFYVLRFGGTFRFVMHIIHEPLRGDYMKNTDKVMMVWQAFGDTAQAFGNFIFLCVCDKTIRQHYNCCSPSTQNDDQVTDDETTSSISDDFSSR